MIYWDYYDYPENDLCPVCHQDCASCEECEDNQEIQRQAKRQAADRMAALEIAAGQRAALITGVSDE